MIMYLPMNPLAISFIESKGLRKSLLLGVSIQVIGFWVRALVNHGFIFNMVGQTLIAVGQPYIYNQPVKLSAVWFPKEERIASTMIAINFSIVGNTIGFFLPLVFIKADAGGVDPAQSALDIQHELWWMLVAMASVETLLLVLLFIFYAEKEAKTKEQPQGDHIIDMNEQMILRQSS